MSVTRRIEVVNEKGLHARASAKLVELVEAYQSQAEVERDGMSATGDSIMGLLMLAASRGTSVQVTTKGPDEEPLMDAIEALFADRFGEEM